MLLKELGGLKKQNKGVNTEFLRVFIRNISNAIEITCWKKKRKNEKIRG